MKWKPVLCAALVGMVAATPLWAGSGPAFSGSRGGSMSQSSRIDIFGYGGYAWTDDVDVYYLLLPGTADITSSGMWGIEADIDVLGLGRLVLLYHRQDAALTLKRPLDSSELSGDIAVEYWHIGGLQSIQRGNIEPFAMLTLGGTRIIPQYPGAGDDTWKFSMMFGVGAKIPLSDRAGLRLQARLPWTTVKGGASIACGTGGCYSMFGGYGIAQVDVSGGLYVSF